MVIFHYFTGLIGPLELGAASVVLQIIVLDYQIPLGIGLAVNIRIGQLLGAKDSKQALRVIYIGMGLTGEVFSRIQKSLLESIRCVRAMVLNLFRPSARFLPFYLFTLRLKTFCGNFLGVEGFFHILT